ncbi:hypothetical protein [Deinococcus murrayi]|uniref:hypothetical protein n=1 Tax=Deinococcus murrayi TaxID=68910 RepID=UPI000483105F|nr:hypothetical protein [Deinococcus murrayi]
MDPTSRSFDDAKRLGDAGEVAVARLLARHREALPFRDGTPLACVVVRVDHRVGRAVSEQVLGVEVRLEPRPQQEQVYGDLELWSQGGEKRTLEVKSEQYALADFPAPAGSRRTENVAFETHDLISPQAYEQLWVRGARRGGRLPPPPGTLAFGTPAVPEWFTREGGHLRTRADWLLHHFQPSGLGVMLSLGRIRQALHAGELPAPWYASCTLTRGSQARCLTPGGEGIKYYTVGKLLNVAELERREYARLYV